MKIKCILNIYGTKLSSYNFKDREGSTPLDREQLEGIKFTHITTMGELDEAEDRNIQDGLDWLNRQSGENYLSIHFLNKLHKKLFGDVWKWAGDHRTILVNLSIVDRFHIGPKLKILFEDTKVWIQLGRMSWDEIAAEFHHRLVKIHPYPNGNGRVARIMTEFLQKRNDQPITSWMSSLRNSPKERRDLYINSLKKADTGDYTKLIQFMKEKRT